MEWMGIAQRLKWCDRVGCRARLCYELINIAQTNRANFRIIEKKKTLYELSLFCQMVASLSHSPKCCQMMNFHMCLCADAEVTMMFGIVSICPMPQKPCSTPFEMLARTHMKFERYLLFLYFSSVGAWCFSSVVLPLCVCACVRVLADALPFHSVCRVYVFIIIYYRHRNNIWYDRRTNERVSWEVNEKYVNLQFMIKMMRL